MKKINCDEIRKQQKLGKNIKVCLIMAFIFASFPIIVGIVVNIWAFLFAAPIPLAIALWFAISAISSYRQDSDLKKGDIYLVLDNVIDKKKITDGEKAYFLILENSILLPKIKKKTKDTIEDGFVVTKRNYDNFAIGDKVYMVFGHHSKDLICILPEKKYNEAPYEIFDAKTFKTKYTKPIGYDDTMPEESKILINALEIEKHLKDVFHHQKIKLSREDIANGNYYIVKDVITDRGENYRHGTIDGADTSSTSYYLDINDYEKRYNKRLLITNKDAYETLHIDDAVYLIYSKTSNEFITILSGEIYRIGSKNEI